VVQLKGRTSNTFCYWNDPRNEFKTCPCLQISLQLWGHSAVWLYSVLSRIFHYRPKVENLVLSWQTFKLPSFLLRQTYYIIYIT